MSQLSKLLAYIEKRASQEKTFFAARSEKHKYEVFWVQSEEHWEVTLKPIEHNSTFIVPKGQILECLEVFEVDMDDLYSQAYQKVATKAVWNNTVLEEIKTLIGEEAVAEEILNWKDFAKSLLGTINVMLGVEEKPDHKGLTLVKDED